MPRYLLACKYGIDDSDADVGYVLHAYGADVSLSLIKLEHSDCVILPYDGDIASLGKYGPEPKLLGEPPTAIAPGHAELNKAGVPHTIAHPDTGETILHPLREMAGKVYPDRRQMEKDTRMMLAPHDWTKEMLKSYAAQEHADVKAMRITVDNIPITVDANTRMAIEVDALRATRDSTFTKKMYDVDGNVKELDAKSIIKLADAVSYHTEKCFNTMVDLNTKIDRGTVKHRKEIDEAFSRTFV